MPGRSRYILAALVVLVGFWLQQWWVNQDQPATETLFVYGTLQYPPVRWLTCRCLTPSEPITVTGFQVQDRDLLRSEPDDTVTGQLLQVTPTELARFDTYERVSERYVRVHATFLPTEPWVYLRRDTAATTLSE